MKHLWFKDVYGNIWKVLEDHSFTKYYKRDNYTKNYLGKTTKRIFTTYTSIYNFKKISEADAILEML